MTCPSNGLELLCNPSKRELQQQVLGKKVDSETCPALRVLMPASFCVMPLGTGQVKHVPAQWGIHEDVY